MDTRAQKAADLRAEDAADRKEAQADAMKTAADIRARDAKAGTATIEKEDRVVSTFRGKEIVTKEQAEEIVLQERLDAIEAEIGDNSIWYLLTRILKGDQIIRVMALARGAAEAAAEVEYNFEGQAYRFGPKETFKDDDESARARAYRAHAETVKVKPVAKPTAKRESPRDSVHAAPDGETVEEKQARQAALPPTNPNKYLLDAIVGFTQSSNRP